MSALLLDFAATSGATPPAATTLDFAGNSYTTPTASYADPVAGGLLAVSRNSIGYAQASTGTWTQFSANTIRRTDNGLLIERSATNYLNNSLNGVVTSGTSSDTLVANVGTLPNRWAINNMPAGVFWQVLATGTDSSTNLPYVDLRFAGTATASSTTIRMDFSGSGNNTGVAPLPTGSYIVGSVFASVRAGTLPINAKLATRVLNDNVTANTLTGTDAFINSTVNTSDKSSDAYALIDPPASVPSAMTRYETRPQYCYATCNNGSLYVGLEMVSGTAYDFTLRLAMPQLETVPDMYGRATSPIYSPNVATTWSAAVTAQTSNTVTSTTGLQIGQVVWGTGVPAYTVITNIVGSTVTLNNAITVTNGQAVQFTGGTRAQDVVTLAGAALTMAQGTTATLKATLGAMPWRYSWVSAYARGIPAVAPRVAPILGLNGASALLQRETDGSISTAYGAGARSFRTFLGNYTLGNKDAQVAWNGTNLALASQAGGDYQTKTSGATSITSLQIGTKGDATALDGYLAKLTLTAGYDTGSTVSSIAADVAVYGAKPGGIVAAYRAKKEGRTVAIIGDWREYAVGGMMAGGLGYTDVTAPTYSVTNSGAQTTGATVLTLTSMTNVSLGLAITGTNIPGNTYIKAISGSQITLSAATTGAIADLATLTINPPIIASDNAIIRVPTTALATKGSKVIPVLYTSNLVVGATISGTGIRTGTTISAFDSIGLTVTLSVPLTADCPSGTTLTTWATGAYGGLPRWVFSRAAAKNGKADTDMYGEPRVFRMVFEDMLCEAGIPVYYSGGVSSVSKTGQKITSFATASRSVAGAVCAAKTITPQVVVGADYEGDFLPLVGISSSVGREANATYGENHNGFDAVSSPSANGGGILQPTLPDGSTAFNVDPWVTAGSPTSGALPGVKCDYVLATTASGSGTSTNDTAYILADNTVRKWNGSAWVVPTFGQADPNNMQAYNFRLTMTRTAGRASQIFNGTTLSLATNATTTAGTVLNFASTTGVAVGFGVFGTGIAYGAVVTAVTSTTVTINQTVTVSSGVSIGFLDPASFGFTAQKAELFIRTIKAFSDAATATSRTFTAGYASSQTSGQWGINDFFAAKGGLEINSLMRDCNAVGGYSLDYVGGNYGYIAANSTSRETIWQDHIGHILRFWWVLQFYVDARIPAALRTEALLWGFDVWSYTDNLATDPTNFNPQLYVREGRRMINTSYTGGGSVFSEVDAGYPSDGTPPRDPKTISVMSYALDSHQQQRFPVYNGGNYTYWNEGGINVFAGQSNGALGTVFGTNKRGVLSMSTITPNASECTNYVTSFHGSMSHPVFGAFRMEASSMAIGEAAGLLAAMAVEGSVGVQSVTYGDTSTAGTFRYRLLNTGANPSGSPTPPVAPLVN